VEIPSSPIGKLLDPCALLPAAAEVETFLGTAIVGNTISSTWVPDNSQGLGNYWTLAQNPAAPVSAVAPILAERMHYECYYDDDHGFKTWISVEVFAEPSDALAQMEATLELYNEYLGKEGLEPMVEFSGLGERAYGFKPTIPHSNFSSYPTIYFLSGNYLVRIGNPSDDFEWSLEVAQKALPRLPADIHSIMAEQDLRLDMSNQPDGKLLEPCELVTRDEAQLYLEAPIAFEESSTNWPGSQNYRCTYGDAGSFHVEINVAYYFQDIEYISSYYEDLGRLEVSGIGDRAFRAAGSPEIVVISANRVINISVSNGSDKESGFQSAFELAELVISRLP
jgi:hypothetical protein